MMTVEFTEEERIRPTDGGTDSKAFGGATHNINAGHAGGTTSAAPTHPRTSLGIVGTVTARYLASLDPSTPPHPLEVEGTLIDTANKELAVENAARAPLERLGLLKSLTHVQVAQVLVRLHRVVRMIPSRASEAMPSDSDPLAIYAPQRGVYLISQDAIASAVSKYTDGGVQFRRDVVDALRVLAPSVRQGSTGEWAAVANGDYERTTGVLHPFSPDRVFLNRVPVNYVETATNPVIHSDQDGTDWDVDSGILEIANGDPGIEQLIWELFAAVTQPHVRTNKVVALFNPVGNNGKGTVLALCSGLAGADNTLNASVATLAKDTTLPLLVGKSLVISDENATNDFVKNAETLKLLATRDPFFVNPKYRQPFNATFEGNQVHCLNALPRFGDHTDSMWRRWLFIPLTASFEGSERMYIRDDYVQRSDVLEYILRRSLEMDFVGFTETDATRDLLKNAKLHNDAARQFWNEHECLFVWDLLPLEFLYEMFKAWFERNKPGGRMVDRATFDESIRSAVSDAGGDWKDLGQGKPLKASVRMSTSEPLLDEYGVDPKWSTTKASKQFRNVIVRDRVSLALVRSEPAPVNQFASASPRLAAVRDIDQSTALTALETLVAKNVAAWEQRAVDDDGVTDPAHVHDHAMIRRTGSACRCSFGVQREYDGTLIDRAQELDGALFILRAEIKDEAA